MTNIITNPVEALVKTGKENSELHEELAKCFAELDLYRGALTQISKMNHAPGPQKIALAALGQRRISA